jgi:hypothetical protein
MANRVYGKIELVGTSTSSIEDAVQNGVAAAAGTYERVDWFEVVEIRGHVEAGRVAHYQVVLKIGYRIGD